MVPRRAMVKLRAMDKRWAVVSSLVLLGACDFNAAPAGREVTLPSGHRYVILAEGPIQGVGWQGLAVKYRTASLEDRAQLRREADEIMQAERASAEAAGLRTILVMAETAPSGGLISKSSQFNHPYERQPDGSWLLVGK
jgi:hypothetical protein